MRRHLTRSLERYRKLAAERQASRLKILLTHSPEARELYYGPRALAGCSKRAKSASQGRRPLEGRR
jgi:hypothetical protein